jgi:hypothetical protein
MASDECRVHVVLLDRFCDDFLGRLAGKSLDPG